MSTPVSPGPYTPVTYTTMVEDQARRKWRSELTNSKQRRERKASFRLRPSLISKVNGQPSLLSRRAEANAVAIEASNTHTLFPHSSNTIDLVTPEPAYLTSPPKSSGPMPSAAMDSGYFSGPSSGSKPTTLSPERASSTTRSITAAYPQPAPTAGLSSNVSDYRSGMHDRLNSQFFKKVVKREFMHDPVKAFEDLQPVMRQMLEKPEDRPLEPKFYLLLDYKRGSIRGEKRMVKKLRRRDGHRVIMGGSPEQMTWYFGPKVGYN